MEDNNSEEEVNYSTISFKDALKMIQSLQGQMRQSVQRQKIPIGTVWTFAGEKPPEGWLLCDGSLVLRTQYADLYGVVKDTYGSGDGMFTFNVPDLRGKVPIGTGTGNNLTSHILGHTGGEEQHVLTVQEMPSHNHSGFTNTDGAHNHVSPPTSNSGSLSGATMTVISDVRAAPTASGVTVPSNGSQHSHGLQIEGGNQGHNNMPPFLALNFIIKY